MESLDPYAAPRAAPANPASATVSRLRRSRWTLLRLIPVVYFGLVAVMCPFCALTMAGLILYLELMPAHPVRLVSPRLFFPALAIPGYPLLGFGGYLTARAWYDRRWRRAILASIAFINMIATGGFLFNHFDLR